MHTPTRVGPEGDASSIDEGWQQAYSSQQWCHHDQAVEDNWFRHSSASTWKPTNLTYEAPDPHVVWVETRDPCGAPCQLPPRVNKVDEADPIVKQKWIPRSAKKVREAANLMGKGRPKAKAAKGKGKGEKIDEQLKEAWNDVYSSDQPLCEGMVEE